jgi:hypothetical protein
MAKDTKSKALEGKKTYNVTRYYSPDSNKKSRIMKKGLSLEDAQKNANEHGAEHSKGKYFHGYNEER